METHVAELLAVGDALNPSDSYKFNANDFGERSGEAEVLGTQQATNDEIYVT